ncbi:MAG: STAS-like domain-containing protein [Methylicorpusculum sp.]|uniref:STAS-like domain-containing protein n=1 Tax=Methylicorpusculum sp. TaxID=2713644 RepID=UPI00271E5F0F|nr:STAS-like domain-containing protein [Methylicorpusculum sp.]MDO8941070.1 STAS-like domain-containing protein [Methylicorpusculum sp.]MDP2202331.1 STAS-like domain-containing protein [Methylicorpusculum sp.]
MISLANMFNKMTLSVEQGKRVHKMTREYLLTHDEPVVIDCAGIGELTAGFFQQLIFPLVAEFSGQIINNRVVMLNLSDAQLDIYQAACDQAGDYVDELLVEHAPTNEIADISLDFLIMAREMARMDPDKARIVFGLNTAMIEVIVLMDYETMCQIAKSGVMCFQPRFSHFYARNLANDELSPIDVFINISSKLERIYER